MNLPTLFDCGNILLKKDTKEAIKPHMIHFARLRDQYRPVYINWLIQRAMYSGESWNRLMALIYAS